MNIEQLQDMINAVESKIDDVKNQIDEKQKEIDYFEYSCSDDEYDQFLDDVYGDVQVCSFEYSTSQALKLLDPIAYRCGKSDYESNYNLNDCEEYNDLKDDLESLEDQLSDLENELEELNDELEELNDELKDLEN